MSYERITERVGEGSGESVCYKYGADKTLGQCLVNILGRLAELEDKIDNGTLVKLPCKVGDTAYILSDPFFTACIESVIIRKIAILGLHRIQVCATGEETHEYYEYVPSEYIFKSKLEAEEKLRELRGEK